MSGKLSESEIKNGNTYTVNMQKDVLIQKLRDHGCRITQQRLLLLDIILSHECTCRKEIYYTASRIDRSIGSATVYRFINTLEEIGALSTKNLFKIVCEDDGENDVACTVELDDTSVHSLSEKNWMTVIKCGMKVCGYITDQEIVRIEVVH